MKGLVTYAGTCALIVAVGGGCRSTPQPTEADRPQPQTTKAEPAKAATPSTVEIDAEMMRDLRITTTKVEERAGGEAVSLLGELRVDEGRYAEVGSPVSARAMRLLVAAGDQVRTGQALAELQSTELGKARADLAMANSRAELAERVLARKRELAGERIVPEREVQEAESQASIAKAEVQAARSALQALGAADAAGPDPSRFLLRTPVSGTVIERTVAVGQMVDPAKPLFEIADLSRVWLIVQAFERDAVRVKMGAPARITLPAIPGRTFDGTVKLVGRRVDVESRTVPVRLELPNRDQMLRPGMSATAAIMLSESGDHIITIPVASLQRLQDRWVVFIPKSDRAFEIRTIGRGRDLAGEVEILTGLRPLETVVVDGSFLLKAEADKGRGEGHEGHER
jgi:cobalt-zinc-cadmium efflux system membrane fusion protein